MIGDFEAPSSTRADVYVDYKGKESGLTGDGMVVEKDKKGKKEVDFVEDGKVVAKVEETPKIEQKVEVEKPIVEEQKIEVEKVEEPFEQDIKDTIESLEILADMGDEEAKDTVEALKLLI